MPTYQEQIQEVERRRRIAQALQQQAMQPQGQQAGRFYVGPSKTSQVAGLVAALGGALMNRRADRDEKTAREGEQKRLAEMLQRITTGTNTPSVMMNGDPGVDGSATPPDPRMQAAQEIVGGLPIESQQQLLAGESIKRLFPAAQPGFTLAPGAARYDASGKEVASRPAAPPSGTTNQRDYAAAYPKDDYPGGYAKWLTDQKRAGATSVNLDTRQETEEDKAVGKAFGEQYVGIQKAGFDASGKIARLDRMEQLLSGVDTGSLTPIGTEIAGFAKSLGFDIDPNLPNKQAAQALAGEMTLAARNPSGGAGMPGAMSDADRKFLQQMTPNLAQTPQGRAMLIETNRKLAQRDQEVAALAREYRAKNGRIDEGFYRVLAEFSARNPLFGTPGEPPAPKLQKNADGSYTYNPNP